MPEMDGYQVLQALRDKKLSPIVIVVSGDIQPEAQKRVLALGALEFIKKPIKKDELNKILNEKNILKRITSVTGPELSEDLRDVYREISNIAIGKAAHLLSTVLDAFIVMPIPNINMLEVNELRMALNQVAENENVTAVCQGFIGSGIAGEALLVFDEASFWDIAQLMKYYDSFDANVEIELLMDLSSILTGAFLKGLSDQLDISFSQSHPLVLGRHIAMDDLFSRSASRWRKTLAIDMAITIENREISCNLLLLFTEDSIERFNELVSSYMEC
jgi:chemotaxis protein CheY-P-specific phosphatase CheC